MSFSFSAKGKRDEVVRELDGLTAGQLGQDRLGTDVRDLLMYALSRSAEASDGQKFSVSAWGHAGSQDYESVVSLGASISLEADSGEAVSPTTAGAGGGAANPTGASAGGTGSSNTTPTAQAGGTGGAGSATHAETTEAWGSGGSGR